MVDNVFFVLQIIGVVILLYWAATRDKKGDDAAHGGLLAMRGAKGDDGEPVPSKRRGEQPTRRRRGNGRRDAS